MSVDVEDWYQSTIDADAALSDRFESSTMKVLEALASHSVLGTFFVLGVAAEKAPHVIKAIADAGHEIQSHGYGHRSNLELDAAALREDLTRAKKILEDLVGSEICAYRAPSFTIDARNLWALDVLVETGHRYDSSIFPLKTSRYGIDGYPPEPRVITTLGGNRIVEAPVGCFDLLGKRRPIGGGGYFRFWPYRVIRRAWRQLERIGRPGIVYMHPYEYDPVEMSAYKQLSWKIRLHQGIGRRNFPRKIDKLLSEFDFTTMTEVLSDLLREL
jgi:polysaccharide deacetylase family protein (PEP-CTERM system associated)